jgi:hypothetical protein
MSRLPHFLDNQLTDGGDAISLTCWAPFRPRKIPGTSGMSYVCRDNHLLNWCIDIYCSCTEYTDELGEFKAIDWMITVLLHVIITHARTHIHTLHHDYTVNISITVSSYIIMYKFSPSMQQFFYCISLHQALHVSTTVGHPQVLQDFLYTIIKL